MRQDREIISRTETMILPEKKANRAGLITEELAIYLEAYTKKEDLMNMVLVIDHENVSIYARNIGKPLDLSKQTDLEIPENFKLLQAIIPQYSYNSSLCMNNIIVEDI